MDLRNGRVAYTLPVSSTPQHLLPIRPEGRDSKIGLASISSDATFRLHATSGVERQGNKGDKEKWTRGIVGVVGGVGGQGVWKGWGEIREEDVVGWEPKEKKEKKKSKKGGEGDEEEDSEEDSEDEDVGEGVWDGMSEIEDQGEEESDEESEEETVSALATDGKKRRKA